jgi:hypothetical protein
VAMVHLAKPLLVYPRAVVRDGGTYHQPARARLGLAAPPPVGTSARPPASEHPVRLTQLKTQDTRAAVRNWSRDCDVCVGSCMQHY